MTLISKVSTLMLGSFATAVTSGVASYALSREIKKTDEKAEQGPALGDKFNPTKTYSIGDWNSDWAPNDMGDLI